MENVHLYESEISEFEPLSDQLRNKIAKNIGPSITHKDKNWVTSNQIKFLKCPLFMSETVIVT
jgi:hypothetical protein